MHASRRRWWVPALLLTASVATGCNMLSLPFFLFSPDPKEPALLQKIAPEDKKKEVKAAIVHYTECELGTEMIRADRELNDKLADQLRAIFKKDEAKVTVVTPRKVEEFKNQHPDWLNMDLEELGKQLKVDYVIYIEVHKLDLFKSGSFHDLLQGTANASITLVNVQDPEKNTQPKEFNYTFPPDGQGGAASMDLNGPRAFREKFLENTAARLSWFFTEHVKQDEYMSQ